MHKMDVDIRRFLGLPYDGEQLDLFDVKLSGIPGPPLPREDVVSALSDEKPKEDEA